MTTSKLSKLKLANRAKINSHNKISDMTNENICGPIVAECSTFSALCLRIIINI